MLTPGVRNRLAMLCVGICLVSILHLDSSTQSAPAQKAWTRKPIFTDYPVRAIYKGRAHSVIIDSPRARHFRTRLREDSKQGPNFAGHYTVVFWGCGTGCAQLAVVDAKTGRVYWPQVSWVDIPDDPEFEDDRSNRNFRLNSRLLILTRTHYDIHGSYTAYYYLFDDGGFRLIRQTEEIYSDQGAP